MLYQISVSWRRPTAAHRVWTFGTMCHCTVSVHMTSLCAWTQHLIIPWKAYNISWKKNWCEQQYCFTVIWCYYVDWNDKKNCLRMISGQEPTFLFPRAPLSIKRMLRLQGIVACTGRNMHLHIHDTRVRTDQWYSTCHCSHTSCKLLIREYHLLFLYRKLMDLWYWAHTL